MRVIAKAYENEPLDRCVVEVRGGIVYLVNASPACAARIDAESGVGFPQANVFDFDPALFHALKAAWAKRDFTLLAQLWSRAVPSNDMTLA